VREIPDNWRLGPWVSTNGEQQLVLGWCRSGFARGLF
jgi:hypothetical protein